MERLGLREADLAAFCERADIVRLSLFGSRSREDFEPDSDVDLLVEFESDSPIGYFRLVELESELGTLMGGLKVDLVTNGALSHLIRDSVLEDSVELYATRA